MMSLALIGLEKAINQYLQLDPDTTSRLTKISDKLIEVSITDWQIQFFVQPTADGIQLFSESSKQADTVVRGKLFALMRIGIEGADSRALFKNEIDISGDTETGEILRDAFQKIDIDWEEHLSHFTGDSIAHQLSYHAKKILDFGKQTFGKLTDNVKEYVHFEAKYFPTSKQVEKLYEEINQIRNDVERLEARIARLKKPISNKKKVQ